MADIYRQLQKRLDQLPVPFPDTEAGSEIRLLKALFSEAEAEIAVHLSALPETSSVIFQRARGLVTGEEELSRTLKDLAKRGAINATFGRRDGKRVVLYGLAPLVVGMFEFQVNKLTPNFVRDFHEYTDNGFRRAVVGGATSQMRTVPVGAAIDGTRAVGSYDDIRAFINRSAGPFAVMNCVCRQGAELIGEACSTSSTHETCLTIGNAAVSTVVGGVSRRIKREEVLAILDRAQDEGHVLQPQNSQEPGFICCCCRDCCEVLRNARKLSRPSDAIPTTHRATVAAESCITCGVCVSRCPMEAIRLTDVAACVDDARCIGCGVCVVTCPVKAITLTAREDAKVPPKTAGAMYLRMFRDRFGMLGLLRAGIRKVLRLKI